MYTNFVFIQRLSKNDECATSIFIRGGTQNLAQQGKEKAQTRKGKKTAGKEKRLLARKKTADKDFRESA